MGKKIETEMQGGSRKDKEAEGGHVSSTQGGRTEGRGHWCPVPTCGETAPTAPPPTVVSTTARQDPGAGGAPGCAERDLIARDPVGPGGHPEQRPEEGGCCMQLRVQTPSPAGGGRTCPWEGPVPTRPGDGGWEPAAQGGPG